MSVELGLIFALIAMLGWGFGDFLIQKSTRKIGDWETLFLICLFGAIVLLPFVYKEIPSLFSLNNYHLLIMLGASCAVFIAALLEFESLKKGKISVVEPIWAIEIIASAVLAIFILNETVTFLQGILIFSLIIGLVMISLRSYHLDKHIWLERGVIFAITGALLMGVANFFVGWGARVSSPLLINWFLNVFIIIPIFFILLFGKKITPLIRSIKQDKKLFGGMCLLDNIAWVAFAFAMVFAPISIAVALSESYIIIAALLGMFISKEKLRIHQKIGLALAVISAIILATTIGNF